MRVKRRPGQVDSFGVSCIGVADRGAIPATAMHSLGGLPITGLIYTAPDARESENAARGVLRAAGEDFLALKFAHIRTANIFEETRLAPIASPTVGHNPIVDELRLVVRVDFLDTTAPANDADAMATSTDAFLCFGVHTSGILAVEGVKVSVDIETCCDGPVSSDFIHHRSSLVQKVMRYDTAEIKPIGVEALDRRIVVAGLLARGAPRMIPIIRTSDSTGVGITACQQNNPKSIKTGQVLRNVTSGGEQCGDFCF